MSSKPRKPPASKARGRRQLLVSLDVELIRATKLRAVDLSTTASSIVEQALRAYLKLEKKSQQA